MRSSWLRVGEGITESSRHRPYNLSSTTSLSGAGTCGGTGDSASSNPRIGRSSGNDCRRAMSAGWKCESVQDKPVQMHAARQACAYYTARSVLCEWSRCQGGWRASVKCQNEFEIKGEPSSSRTLGSGTSHNSFMKLTNLRLFFSRKGSKDAIYTSFALLGQ